MTIGESQRTSIREIVGWSLLCGLIVVIGGVGAAYIIRYTNEFAFRDLSGWQEFALFAGVFVLGTLATMGFLFKIKWVEEEGPAKVADEIERRLNRK